MAFMDSDAVQKAAEYNKYIRLQRMKSFFEQNGKEKPWLTNFG